MGRLAGRARASGARPVARLPRRPHDHAHLVARSHLLAASRRPRPPLDRLAKDVRRLRASDDNRNVRLGRLTARLRAPLAAARPVGARRVRDMGAKHADSVHTVYDDCGQAGCEIPYTGGGPPQVISFSFEMPACDGAMPEECDEYPHGCVTASSRLRAGRHRHAGRRPSPRRGRSSTRAIWPLVRGAARGAKVRVRAVRAGLSQSEVCPSRLYLSGGQNSRLGEKPHFKLRWRFRVPQSS